MDIRPNYNPENSIFTLEFSSDLIRDYFNNLRGMLLDNKSTLSNLEITRKSGDTAKITFKVSKEEMSRISSKASTISSILNNKDIPEELKSSMMDYVNKDVEVSVISVDGNDTSNPLGKVNNVINKFISLALKDKLKTTEFLPINNYPDNELKVDVLNALQGKRNLCIIDDFENYKEQTRLNTYSFNQYIVKYGTSEYADTILMLVNDEFDKFKEYYNDKLISTSWI